MIICPICDVMQQEPTYKEHLANAHVHETLQRLKSPGNLAIQSIESTGLKIKVVGTLIKEIQVGGELWANI